ncbi:MAG: ThiF family adenylyltransferase [Thermoplasmata archaeon]
MNRYNRHKVLPEIGERGQKKIEEARVAVLGLGSLGSAIADSLARTGVGYIRVVDRDYVEISNLNHQILFDEESIDKPKVEAGAERLENINSSVEIDPVAENISASNIEQLIEEIDIVLDATDNMKTRYIINDACVKNNIRWIFTSVLQTYGMNLNIIPNKGPCLRCLMPEKPERGSMETTETAGVLFTLPRIMGNISATEAVKYITGNEQRKEMLTIDLWKNDYELIKVNKRENCKTCGEKDFEFLSKEKVEQVEIHGENSVQISPEKKLELNLQGIKDRFKNSEIKGKSMLRIQLENYELNLFKDGKLIVDGTDDPKKAKSLYSRYIGD